MLEAVHNSTVELLLYPGMWKYLVMALFLLNLKQTYRYESLLFFFTLNVVGATTTWLASVRTLS